MRFKKLLNINIILFSLFCMSCFQAKAFEQNKNAQIDSLELKLVLSPDSIRLSLINKIAAGYLTIAPLKSIEIAKEALAIAQHENNFIAQSTALNTLGQAQRLLLSDFDKALEFCFQALKIDEAHRLKPQKAITLSSIAEIYMEVGNNYKALEFYMQSLILYQDLGESEGTIKTLNSIGLINSHLNKPQKALEYHKQALALSKAANLPVLEANTIHLMAEVFKREEKYGDAIKFQNSALAIRRAIENDRGISESLTALGEIYALQDDSEKALDFYLRAIKYQRQTQNFEGLAKSYNGIGSLLIKTKEYKRAIRNLELALKHGIQTNSKKHIRDSYELLYMCHFSLENYAKALEYKDLFIAISEFIYSEESERKIAEMQSKFEIDKKEDEIELLKSLQEVKELQLGKQEDLKNFLLTGLVLFAIIAVLIYYLYQTKRKSNVALTETNFQISEKNKALEELNATKDKFFSIISHDLRGPLNSLTSFSSLLINHTAHLSKEEIQMLAKDLDKSVKGLFGLLENLLDWSRSQSGNIEIKPEVLDAKDLIIQNKQLLSKTAEIKNISIVTPENIEVAIMADRNSVNTVIRNLISNAIKFTPIDGQIRIEARESSNMVMISIEDNGVGMSGEVLDKLFRIDKKHSTKGTANEKGTGLGLILCKEFVEKNGGAIAVESIENKGTIFTVTLPKAQLSRVHASLAS